MTILSAGIGDNCHHSDNISVSVYVRVSVRESQARNVVHVTTLSDAKLPTLDGYYHMTNPTEQGILLPIGALCKMSGW